MIAGQKSHLSQHVGSMIMTWSKGLATMVTYAVRGATKPGEGTPGVAPAGTAVAFLQGFKQHTAKDRQGASH